MPVMCPKCGESQLLYYQRELVGYNLRGFDDLVPLHGGVKEHQHEDECDWPYTCQGHCGSFDLNRIVNGTDYVFLSEYYSGEFHITITHTPE